MTVKQHVARCLASELLSLASDAAIRRFDTGDHDVALSLVFGSHPTVGAHSVGSNDIHTSISAKSPQALADYLQLRHSLGHELAEPGRLLPGFVAYLDACGLPPVTIEATLAWAQQAPKSPAGRVTTTGHGG